MASVPLRLLALLAAATMAAPLLPTAAALAPPSPPQGVAAEGEPGGNIVVSWQPRPPGEAVQRYLVYGSDWEGFERLLAEVEAPQTSYAEGNLGPRHTRSYYVVAVDAAGASAPSARASGTTPWVCAETPPPFCIIVHPVTKVGDLVAGPPGTPLASVQLELGRVRVQAAGTYAEQAIVVPRSTGVPSLDGVGATVGTTDVHYRAEGPVGPPLALAPPGGPPALQVVGSLWVGRFQLFVAGEKVTDVPVGAVREGAPGPDPPPCQEGCNAPGPAVALVGLAAAGAAALAAGRRGRRWGTKDRGAPKWGGASPRRCARLPRAPGPARRAPSTRARGHGARAACPGAAPGASRASGLPGASRGSPSRRPAPPPWRPWPRARPRRASP